ncbi:MAG: adenosylmethionine--8-amino-7-oxononanoate transaminase [Bdellovibrionota bacterium]
MLLTDKKHCWHPYTQHFRQSPPLLLKKAKGIFLELEDGRKIIDGSSSWWVNTIGHGRPEIAAAIKKQQQELDHVIFAGATHAPAIYLAKKIITLADSHLSKVFFSDNGSTAVEVGLKMAFQKFVNRGELGRTKFLGFKGSYHGDTLGAMSVGKSDGFHGMFKPLLFETIWAEPATMHKSVYCPNGELDLKDKIADLKALLEKHHNELAGIIIEPLVQGAGGMLVQPFSFLEAVQKMANQFDLPLIFDEVFTGLGRVGASFAFKRASLKPDIVCIAKGLTGGNLPLALTLTHDGIFEHFLDESKTKALLHGHSYTANPISCSAALATLDIVHNENLIEKSQDIEKHFSSWLSSEGKKLNLENPRCIGAILAFELPGSGFGDYFSHRANNFTRIALKNGLMLRTLGNTVYFVPPLTISKDECTYALTQISHTLQELHKEAR